MYVIAGIDAGINVGYALIDLNGQLVAAGVERDANDETIVRLISRIGIPSMVATDVSPASSFVSKVAARFNVKVYTPKKSMSSEEKRDIGNNIFDPHIRDAYAAAVKAFRKYANRLRQIDKMDVEDKSRLKHMVIQGEALDRIVNPKNKTRAKNVERKSAKKSKAKKKK